MAVDADTVRRVAHLARIAVAEDEVAGLQGELNAILAFVEQLGEVFARQGLVPTYGIERVRELIRYIQPTGNLLLLRARDREGRCIATGIFIVISSTTMYFWGNASWREYQSQRPNDLLTWTAMLAAKKRGVGILDLGGAGDYKKKFGGRPIAVPWIRVSSQPFVPLLRDAAKALYKMKQRFNGNRRLKRAAVCPEPSSGPA